MGRLLEIARAQPPPPAEPVPVLPKVRPSHPGHPADGGTHKPERVNDINVVSPPPAPWSQPAADVLGVLVEASAPVPHPALLRGLMERGHGKEKARAAIADCQKRGWIEHDLMDGYVLAGG